ncbi:MAG: undecaprenyl-diphosphate phosphatase [Thermodesulfobacteriota bacterium]|nr:undecaprenyl-diphosphate phosphatase [Thermodesulfobacteriota bacterium]
MFKAIILGVIQGLTEFLPVSSSGHLVLGQRLFGLKEPELLFDIILHIATLVAVVIVFRREIAALTVELFHVPGRLGNGETMTSLWRERPMFRLLILIAAGSVPTGLIGFGFKDMFESLFASTHAVGLALLVTGSVLFLTKKAKVNDNKITGFGIKDALLIGLAQGLAITPGLSRSGLTISAGLFLGLDRELAARYSFLLFIPAVLGALAVQLASSGPSVFGPASLAAGFAAALVSGLAALTFLLRLVQRGHLHYFAYYCWLAGLVTVGLTLWAE